jgi:RNA polymerase sigma factor (sigma-70 family)
MSRSVGIQIHCNGLSYLRVIICDDAQGGSDAAVVMDWIEGFEELFRSTYPSMVRLAYLMLGSRSEAEEVVQEAALNAGRRDSENPHAYYRRSVVNGSVAVLRRRAIAESHQPDPPPLEEPSYLVELRDCLLTLPERQRAAIALRFLEGLPDSEIGQILDCREGTVRSLISRGLATLRNEVIL